MKCPKCLTEYACGCKNCLERNKGKPLWGWTEDDNFMICPECKIMIEDFDGPDEDEFIREWRKERGMSEDILKYSN